MRTKGEKTEKLILRISLFSGILFVIVELVMALYTQSQSILMDTAFDASELIVIAASLLLTPLLYRPITEKRPYGYAQCESLFIVVKGFMLTAVTLSLISSNIQVMLNGGNHVNTTLISLFELILSAISLAVLLTLRYFSKKLHSPIIKAEIYGWKIDVIAGMGVSIAFLIPAFLKNTPLAGLAPYFDQIVAVLLALLMLPEPIKMVVKASKDMLLFAPGDDIVARVKIMIEPVCQSMDLEIIFCDVLQTGRRTWIAVTLKSSHEDWKLSQLKETYDVLMNDLHTEFEDISLELIPSLEE